MSCSTSLASWFAACSCLASLGFSAPRSCLASLGFSVARSCLASLGFSAPHSCLFCSLAMNLSLASCHLTSCTSDRMCSSNVVLSTPGRHCKNPKNLPPPPHKKNHVPSLHYVTLGYVPLTRSKL